MVQLLTNLLRRTPPPPSRKQSLDLLFADQAVTQLPALPPVENATWTGRLALAAEALRNGQQAAAVDALRAVMGDESAATRAVLWAAATFRMLGQQPPRSGEILGAVVEVPVGAGTDVLAAYADGTARYVNHAGPMIIWEVPDPHVHLLIKGLFAAAAPALKLAVASHPLGRPPSMRVTLLMTGGNRSLMHGSPEHAELFDSIREAGRALRVELLNCWRFGASPA